MIYLPLLGERDGVRAGNPKSKIENRKYDDFAELLSC